MPILFDRTICCNLDETLAREWLITNGIGSYASGTVAGTLTRRQQGLLVASLAEEAVPQLLLAKIDEEVLFDQRTYYLGTNEYRDGTLSPAGFVHLENFRLEEGFPIFTYRLGGADGIMLEKRIWMIQGQNSTYIQYRVLRTEVRQQTTRELTAGRQGYTSYGRSTGYLEATQPQLTLTLLPFVAHRPYDQPQHGQHDRQFQVQIYGQQTDQPSEGADPAPILPQGLTACAIQAWNKSLPYHLLVVGHPESQAHIIPTGVWYWHFLHRHDKAAGLEGTDDLYLPGVVRTKLWPDKDFSLTIIMSTEELSSLPSTQKQVDQAYEQALAYQRSLLNTQSYFGEGGGSVQTLPVLPFHHSSALSIQSEEFLQVLYQASDRLVTRRTLPSQSISARLLDQEGSAHAAELLSTITPNYYELADDTRATLIALPGLMVATRRFSETQRLLRFLSRHFRQGLLPDRLPTTRHPELADEDYTGVDTTLWFMYALDKYLRATYDYELLGELYPHLTEGVAWYLRGTYHGIQVDPADGLLRTTDTGDRALTWMNARAQGKPVTARVGKPVEVNALWYHALSLLHEWSQVLYRRGRSGSNTQLYAEQADLCRRSFNQRFWYQDGAHLFDVVDGPAGDDASLRPNQLLACSLRFPVLEEHRRNAVLDAVTQHLVTPSGLRTLSPLDPSYQGQLPQRQEELALALHQGAAWPWLIGPYIDTTLRVAEQSSQASRKSRPIQPALYREYVWRTGLHILEPFFQHLSQNMLGSIGAVYAGNAPHASGPQLASALSLGELLRTYKMLAHMGVQHFDQVISV